MPLRPTLTAALSAAVLLSGCGTSGDAGPDGPPGSGPAARSFGHVHALAVNPADDLLYVGSHHGVFVHDGDGFEPVGEEAPDAMSFAIAGPDHFLMSGHPDPGSSGPAHLGLTESRDAGRSWQALSLEGKADFHALEASGDHVYGVDSQTGLLKLTTDGLRWRDLGQLPAVDLAVDPTDPERLLLTDGRGAVFGLEVPGEPEPVSSSPPVVLVDWATPDVLAGVGPDGTVHRSSDGGGTWERAGALPGPPHAFAAGHGAWYAATEAGILTSTDEGRSWGDLGP